MVPAFASWHWSSPYEVCGDTVIKKGEKCDLDKDKKVAGLEKFVTGHAMVPGLLYQISSQSQLNDVIVDYEAKAMVLKIDAASNGQISFVLPENLLESGYFSECKNELLLFLIDGKESDFQLTKTKDGILITIGFEQDDSEIELIGGTGTPESLKQKQDCIKFAIEKLPPKQQMRHGVTAEMVKCREGFDLMIRHNGSPACVRHETAIILEERNWGGPAPPCCKPTEVSKATNFAECIAEGNPAMESHPRQCRTVDGKLFVEDISAQRECERMGGLWGVWGNAMSAGESCNNPTSDAGVECSDSSQCQSFCQAEQTAEINSQATGTCYGYELAICMKEIRDGVVQNEWCQ